MGIKGLMKLISDMAPSAIREQDIKNFFGRKIAIDASMCLYQFLIAVRSGPENAMLTNEFGDVTSHLQGIFHRTIRMMENGIKPIYVFDGKPPALKDVALSKRKENREKAQEELKEAKEDEDQEAMNKYNKRLVRVTKEHNQEARRLLCLMGVPIIEAPGEAEAQCAALCRAGVVYATATEDMDALTFNSPRLIRNLTFSAAQKKPLLEIELDKVLAGLNMDLDQFIDFCILCGCDYTETIKGIGPKNALKMLQTHKSMEVALKQLDKSKFKIPDDFLHKEAHELFAHPDVKDAKDLELNYTEPDEEGLIKFLVNEKGFNLERVQGSLKKLKASKGKSSQQRIESFFVTAPKRKDPTSQASSQSSKKAKAGTKADATGKKKLAGPFAKAKGKK